MTTGRKRLTAAIAALALAAGVKVADAQFASPTCAPPGCSPAVIQNISLGGVAQSAGINITGDAKLGATLQAGALAPVLNAAGQNLIYGNVGGTSSAGSIMKLQNGGVDRFVIDLIGNLKAVGNADVQGGTIQNTTGALTIISNAGSPLTLNSGNGTVVLAPGDNLSVPGNLTVVGTVTGNGSGLSGVVAGGLAGGTYASAYTFNNAGNSFTGSGAGLTNLNASNLSSGTVPSGVVSGTYSNAVTFNNAGNSFTGNGSGLTSVTASGLAGGTYSNAYTFNNAANSFTGSGAGLTSLNASNITTGTLADARLSANVALLNANNVFTGNNTFSGMTTLGSTALSLGAAQNLLYGVVASTSTGSLLKLQTYSGGVYADRFVVDSTGNLTVGSVPWARLTSYPAACPGGQYASAVGGTLTCGVPSGAVTSVSGSGAGISVAPTTGAVVVSNTGVTSAVAGTDISVSGATGAVTINDTSTLASVTGRGNSTPAYLGVNGATPSSAYGLQVNSGGTGAILGSSATGTGVYGSSSSGYGLQAVSISGSGAQITGSTFGARVVCTGGSCDALDVTSSGSYGVNTVANASGATALLASSTSGIGINAVSTSSANYSGAGVFYNNASSDQVNLGTYVSGSHYAGYFSGPVYMSGPVTVGSSSIITGSGTYGYDAIWTSASKLGNGVIYDTGSGKVGIGTTTPGYPLEIDGTTGSNLYSTCSGASCYAIRGYAAGASGIGVYGAGGSGGVGVYGNGVGGAAANFWNNDTQGWGGGQWANLATGSLAGDFYGGPVNITGNWPPGTTLHVAGGTPTASYTDTIYHAGTTAQRSNVLVDMVRNDLAGGDNMLLIETQGTVHNPGIVLNGPTPNQQVKLFLDTTDAQKFKIATGSVCQSCSPQIRLSIDQSGNFQVTGPIGANGAVPASVYGVVANGSQRGVSGTGTGAGSAGVWGGTSDGSSSGGYFINNAYANYANLATYVSGVAYAGYFGGNVNVTGTLTVAGIGVHTGNGTANYVPKYTAASTLGNSQVFDNGTNVGIGTGAPADKLEVNGNLRIDGTVTCIQGNCPTNNAIRLTPNLHLNSGAGYAVIANWDNGTTGATQTFRIGNGAGSDVFYVYADGQAYTTNWWRSLGNTGWYNQTYGGGWWMQDSTWIRSYGGKNLYVDANSYLGAGWGNKVGIDQQNNFIGGLQVNGGIMITANGGPYWCPTYSGYGFNGRYGCDDTGMFTGNGADLYLYTGGSNGVGYSTVSAYFNDSAPYAYKYSGGSWGVYSDRRIKDNIKPFTDGLATIEKINPVSFTYNGLYGSPKGGASIGVIAQEIKDVMPYAVSTQKKKLLPTDKTATDIYAFDPSALDFILINAVKELDAKALKVDKDGNVTVSWGAGSGWISCPEKGECTCPNGSYVTKIKDRGAEMFCNKL